MDKKKHIYFMPGLGASIKIFEYIDLPKDQYEFHYLDWLIPETVNESIENYTKRICEYVKHENPILVGVSFGGIIVQEMSKIIKTQRIIIISSIKNANEVPKRMKFLRLTRAYKLLPYKNIAKMEDFSRFGFNNVSKKKSELYSKYLEIKSDVYLRWALTTIINWNSSNSEKEVFHIHGSNDEIFPIKHIKNCEIIEGGTHAMIITKARKINAILLEIL